MFDRAMLNHKPFLQQAATAFFKLLDNVKYYSILLSTHPFQCFSLYSIKEHDLVFQPGLLGQIWPFISFYSSKFIQAPDVKNALRIPATYMLMTWLSNTTFIHPYRLSMPTYLMTSPSNAIPSLVLPGCKN